jgi:hypothetical protein
MPRPLDNPDRDFSATPSSLEAKELRDLLKESDIADAFDPIIRERLGKVISRAVGAR